MSRKESSSFPVPTAVRFCREDFLQECYVVQLEFPELDKKTVVTRAGNRVRNELARTTNSHWYSETSYREVPVLNQILDSNANDSDPVVNVELRYLINKVKSLINNKKALAMFNWLITGDYDTSNMPDTPKSKKVASKHIKRAIRLVTSLDNFEIYKNRKLGYTNKRNEI